MSALDLVRLDPGLPPPERAHPDDAGLDLRTTVDVRIGPGERVLVGTGVAVALPPGHVGLVCARSGLAARHGIGLVNAPGVIDAGYRGEIRVCLVNHDRHTAVDLHRGDRVAQLLVQRVELPTVRVVDALPGSARGEGGFGSTGSGDNLRDPRPFTSREGHGQGIENAAGSADGQMDAGPGRPRGVVGDEGALKAVVATEPARGRHRKGRIAQVPGHGEPAGRRHHQHHGPWDAENAPRDGRLRLDLGSVQLPVPPGATLIAEPDPSGPLRAVHVMVPEGRLTVSAFAAPRTGGLWAELVEELAAQLHKEGATIRRDRGEWGRELVARNGDVVARVVAVEGPRWLLRGVGTGPAQHALTLHGMLRDMVRGTVVVRSPDPLPVRSLLPLEVPDDVPEPFRDSLYQTLPTRPRQIAGQDGPVIPMMLPQKADSGTSPGRS